MRSKSIFLLSLAALLAGACQSSSNSDGDGAKASDTQNINFATFKNLCLHSSGIAERDVFRRLQKGYESCEELSKRVFELTTIDLSYSSKSRFHPEDSVQTIKTVSPLKYLINAKTMLLQGNDIDDLSPLQNLKTLTELNVSYNPITSVPEISSLEVLDISGTKISSIRGAGLVKALKEIYIAGLKIDQAEIDELDQVSVLKEHCARLDIHYNDKGFDDSGMHRNKTPYDNEGFDCKGYNQAGFDRTGIHKSTGTEFGPNHMTQTNSYFDSNHKTHSGDYYHQGFDYQGYDKNGFNRNRIHRDSGTIYHNGYDYQGNDRQGFNASGIHRTTRNEFGIDGLTQSGSHFDSNHRTNYGSYYHNGYDYQGYNRQGFNASGIHRDTQTEFNQAHMTQSGSYFNSNHRTYTGDLFHNGYDYRGYNRQGFNASGIHRDTRTEFNQAHMTQSGSYFNSNHRTYTGDRYRNGYNYRGYNQQGFNASGIHRDTRTEFNLAHMTQSGSYFNSNHRTYTGDLYRNGYDYQGYNRQGFNASGIHRDTRTRFNLSHRTYNGDLYHNGYDYRGYNRQGFNASGIHRDTRTEFNLARMTQSGSYFNSNHRTYTGDLYRNGYDYQGFDSQGFNASGIHRDTRTEFNRSHMTQSGSYFNSNHRTYTGDLYHNGYDYQGYNPQGFNASGIHRVTGTRYAPGQQAQTVANANVNNTDVSDQNYYENGFRPDGTHRNGTRHNQDGFTREIYQRKMAGGGIYCSVPQNIRTALVPDTLTNQDLDQIIKRCKELSPLSYQNYDEESQRFTELRRTFNLSHYNRDFFIRMNRTTQDYLRVYINSMIGNRRIDRVVYRGEPGVDHGGVYRDFFGHLANRFVHTAMSDLDENRYFFKRNDGAAFDVINPNAAADQLGGSERHIGNAVASIIRHELVRGGDRNSAFSYPTINLRLPVLYKLKILGRAVTDLDIKAAWLMEDDESKNTFKNMVQYFQDSRDYATDPLDQLDDFTDGFHQLISVNSMTMQHMTVDDLGLIITGPQMVTNQILKDRFSISNTHLRANQARAFWNRYVDEELTTTEKKQRILQVITGGPFLPERIRFIIVDSANIAAHTCFNSIDIPETTLEDYNVFKGALESLYDLIGFNVD